jgi:hypothetical protein
VGRRSRQRPEGAPAPVEAPPPAAPATRRGRARMEDAPKPPWHPFPLVELCVALGIVLIAVGFFGEGARSRTALAAGIALSSVAGLEVALREHLAGFRSHSLLLAGAAALGLGVPLAFLTTYVAGVVVCVVAFPVAVLLLRRRFRAKAGVAFRA